MPLAGPDAESIVAEGEALLVAGRDDILELLQGKGNAVFVHGLEQVVHGHPAGAVEPQPTRSGSCRRIRLRNLLRWMARFVSMACHPVVRRIGRKSRRSVAHTGVVMSTSPLAVVPGRRRDCASGTSYAAKFCHGFAYLRDEVED